MSPLSLTYLQVSIGGQNILNSTLNMTYENFLKQVNLAEQLTSSDFGASTGLISQGYWESSKWYFVNVERGNIADQLQPRNINVIFNNNRNVPIDVIIFTFYSDQLTDRQTHTHTNTHTHTERPINKWKQSAKAYEHVSYTCVSPLFPYGVIYDTHTDRHTHTHTHHTHTHMRTDTVLYMS